MENNNVYTTTVKLNAEEAKNNIEQLEKKVQELVARRDALNKRNPSEKGYFKILTEEINAAKKQLKFYESDVMKTIRTLDNLAGASAKDIQQAQKAMQKMLDTMPRDSDQYQEMAQHIREAKAELENIKAVKAFDEVQAGVLGTGKSARQLGAEFRFLRTTMENIGTASVDQLEKALDVARQHFNMAKQGSAAYERAADRIKQISAQLEIAKSKQKESNLLIDKYDREINAAKKDIETIRKEDELIERTLKNLNSSNIRDIEYSLKIIKENLRTMPRGEVFEKMQEKAKLLENELKRVNGEAVESNNIFSRLITGLNKNWGAITQIFGAITGISATIRSAVNEYATMEEEMANTRKYTGMTADQVRDLNEAFKEMDTRTGREQLNQLAGAAGRLGLQPKKDILDFVEAADMIGIALGDDLGDGAVDKIGKLAMAFGEDEEKGLKGAMLATGSALNELAQNSSAQAGYLVEFTARVAGFGKQLGLTQAQIMGFGTVMDENLLKDEMAATAFGNMLTKMQTNTQVFAQIAGKSIEDFTKLLREDANSAILAVADSLKRQDPTTMMKMLDSMGLDGSRAVGVLSTLADKIDDVRKHQQRAKEAYEAGTSVIEEFGTMNDTVQARIDKCKKSFQEMTVELGERLLPVVKYTITSGSLLARGLSVLMKFVYDFKTSIITLTAAIVLWNIQTIASVTWHKVLKPAIDAVVTSVKNLYKALATNPYAAAAAATAVLVAVIYDLAKASKEASKAQEVLSGIEKETKKNAVDETAEMQQLIRQLELSNISTDRRKELLEEINGRLMREHLGNITEEDIRTGKAKDTLELYNKALQSRIKNELKMEKLKEAMKKKEDAENGEVEWTWGDRIEQFFFGNQTKTEVKKNEDGELEFYATDRKSRIRDRVIKEQQEIIDAIQEELDDDYVKNYIHERLEAQRQQLEQMEGQENNSGNNDAKFDTKKYWEAEIKERTRKLRELRKDANATASAIEDAEKAVKEAQGKLDAINGTKDSRKEEKEKDRREREEKKRLKERVDAVKAESDAAIAAKTHEYAMGKIAYRQYIQEMAMLQMEGLKKRRDVYKQGSAEYEKLNREIEELSYKGDQQVNQMKLDDLHKCMLLQQAEIEAQAAREEITEQEKQIKLKTLEETYLADKVELYKKGSKERMDAEWELEQVEQRNKTEREKLYQQQLENIRQQYLGLSNTKQMEITLKGLDELHSQGLIKEREYQEAKLAIQAQYANYETSSEHDQRVAGDALKVASSYAKQNIDQKNPKALDMPILGDIQLYSATMDQLKQMYQNDQITHAQYLAAKQQATAQFCESLASQMQAAYNAVNQVMSAASSYFSAQQEYETAQVQKKYEKEIAAAGNNQKKVKKLQEKQQKEEAAIKSKYAKRAAAIQIAQAVAQTAVSAINAYSSAAAIPVTGFVLAPIAAAMAIAAGMLQIATIKKQQQAQEAGYYEGGFTGGSRYRKEAGVVHEGEFVANHQAVNNPNVLPFLNFLDKAQRNNTVGSLTAQDVSQQLGTGASSIVTPIVNVQTDNEELKETLKQSSEATERLTKRLKEPFDVRMSMQELDRDYKHYQDLINNK